MDKIIEKITDELYKNSSQEAKLSSDRYHKDKLEIIGVRVPEVRRISRNNFPKEYTTDQIFEICDKLYNLKYELTIVANAWLRYIQKDIKAKHFKYFDKWVKTKVNNWATCDDLCTGPLGKFFRDLPKQDFEKNYLPYINKWSVSKNKWERRAAAVSLIPSVEANSKIDVALDISTILLEDQEDIVRKGYGWLLKDATKCFEKEIIDFVTKNVDKMPRVSFRYAIEKLNPEVKSKLMKL